MTARRFKSGEVVDFVVVGSGAGRRRGRAGAVTGGVHRAGFSNRVRGWDPRISNTTN